LTSEQKQLIERAATHCGISTTEFVVASAMAAATDTINKHQILSLHGESLQLFLNAILDPPAPSDAARRAAKLYKVRKDN